jgi:hypothetical protein
MDHEHFPEREGIFSGGWRAQSEGCESERSSEQSDGEMVEVAAHTQQASVDLRLDLTLEMLFQSRGRRSRVAPTSASTSLFSERTRQRWELAEQQVRASGDQAPHAGGMLLRQIRRLQGIGREGVRMGHLPHGQPLGRPEGQPYGQPAGLLAGQPQGQPEGQPDGWPEGQAECWPGKAATNASAGAHNPVRATGRWNSCPHRNGNWSNAQLQGALRAYDQGTSVNGAAAMFDIPRTTF